MTICFVALATGLTLKLHLLSHKHPDNHTSSRCPTCQQLLITPNKFVLEPQFSLPDTDSFQDEIEFPLQPLVPAFRYEPFGPRPPPDRPASYQLVAPDLIGA
jgi:hypothetical protein